MKKILLLTCGLGLASCVQQNVAPPPAPVASPAPVVAAPAPAAKPVAKPKAPAPKPVAKPAPKPAAPAALPPLRGTHSTIIQESDRVQTARSMGGSAVYQH